MTHTEAVLSSTPLPIIVGKRYASSYLSASSEKKQGSKRALIACHFKPYPVRNGTDLRFMMILEALQDLGYEVAVYSSNAVHENLWTAADVELVERDLQLNIAVHQQNATDKQMRKLAFRTGGPMLAWQDYITPAMQKSFLQVYNEVTPEVVVVNYLFFAKLAIGDSFLSSVRIIDTLDLLTLHMKLKSVVWEFLENSSKPPFGIDTLDPRVLDEKLFDSQNYTADQIEYALYNQYDCTIAINQQEADLLKQNCPQTHVEYIPFSFKLSNITNTYDQPPVFVIGPNPFNYQGYLYFAAKVLPYLRKINPNFKLHVLGDGSTWLRPVEGVELLGFVPDVNAVYARTRFAICPMIGGTGQQAKVLEALAHGVPVVVLKNVAERCPVVHEVNGLIAENAEQFAEYANRLMADLDLCRQLGNGARLTIAEEFSGEILKLKLKQLICTATEEKKVANSKTRALPIQAQYLIGSAKIKMLYYKHFGLQLLLDSVNERRSKYIAYIRIKLAIRGRLKRALKIIKS